MVRVPLISSTQVLNKATLGRALLCSKSNVSKPVSRVCEMARVSVAVMADTVAVALLMVLPTYVLPV